MVNDAEEQVLKMNLNSLMYEIDRLRSTLMTYEKKPKWLILFLFWTPKNQFLSSLRIRIHLMEQDLTKLRLKRFANGNPAPARSVEPG